MRTTSRGVSVKRYHNNKRVPGIQVSQRSRSGMNFAVARVSGQEIAQEALGAVGEPFGRAESAPANQIVDLRVEFALGAP